jgi:hypothetical protein
MTDERIIEDGDRRLLLARVCEEHGAEFEAREALYGLIVRAADEVRFGLRPLDVDELSTLALAWSWLESGDTPAEAQLKAANQKD